MEDSLPASHNVDVPNIKRIELSLIAVDGDGYVSLMDNSGNMRSDVRLPEDSDEDQELSKRIRDYAEKGTEVLVTILSAMNIEKIIEVKEV
jgi:translation initiation factor 5A